MEFSDLYADLQIARMEYGKKKNPSDLETDYWYCFDEFCEGTKDAYYKICELCEKHGIRRVVDIGCSYAFQNRIFFDAGIDYVGLERLSYTAYYNREIERYVQHGTYPVKYRATDRKVTAAISNLCVGYEADSDEVYKQIAADFDYFCGGFDGKVAEKLKKYFSVTQLDKFLFWCEKK